MNCEKCNHSINEHGGSCQHYDIDDLDCRCGQSASDIAYARLRTLETEIAALKDLLKRYQGDHDYEINGLCKCPDCTEARALLDTKEIR